MFGIFENFCHDCNSDLLATGHTANCVQITSERGVVAARTSRLSPEGAPKSSRTWATPKRRASAVVRNKLKRDGTIDKRFKTVVE